MKKLEGNNTIKSLFIVALILVIFFIVIAAIVKIDEYKRSFYKIDIKFKTNDIVQLNNKLPISDTIGKEYSGTGVEKGIIEYKEFTISNPNDKKIEYEIYLIKISSSLRNIRSSYIKLYFTDEKNNPIEGFANKKTTTYYDLLSLNNKPGGRLLYRGSLKEGESKTFILRSWVADTYILSQDEEEFSFNIDARLK